MVLRIKVKKTKKKNYKCACVCTHTHTSYKPELCPEEHIFHTWLSEAKPLYYRLFKKWLSLRKIKDE